MPLLCGALIRVYIIEITDSHSNKTVYNTTSLTTSVNVTGLKQGVEYSITVFGRIGGTNGDKTSLLLTLDGTTHKHVTIHHDSNHLMLILCLPYSYKRSNSCFVFERNYICIMAGMHCLFEFLECYFDYLFYIASAIILPTCSLLYGKAQCDS